MSFDKKHLIIFLMLHLLIYSVYNFAHPITPQFIKSIDAPIYMTGLFLSVMALSQFSFAPLWGQISDLFGRKIAYIGPLGYFVGQMGFVFFSDPVVLVIFRFISGAFAIITTTVHFAYISDKSPEELKSKYLGIASLLMPIGIFFGYSIGGALGDIFTPRTTFLIQAIASLICAVVLYYFMDSPKKENATLKLIEWNVFKENIAILKRNKKTILKYILIITFLNIIAFQLTISQIAVILTNAFDKNTTYIGLFVAFFNLAAGLLSFLIQPMIFKSKNNNSSFLPSLSFISIFCAFVLFIFSKESHLIMWLMLMILTILNTTFVALIQDLITKIDNYNEKGALIGLNQGIQSLGLFVGSISSGIAISIHVFGPFILGMVVFIITFIVNEFVVKKQIKQANL